MNPQNLLYTTVFILFFWTPLAAGQENSKGAKVDYSLTGYLDTDYARRYMEFTESQEKKYQKITSEYEKQIDKVKAKKELDSDQKSNSLRDLKNDYYKSLWNDVLVPRQQKKLKHLKLHMKITYYGLSYTITRGLLAEENQITPKERKDIAEILPEVFEEYKKEIEKAQREAAQKLVKNLSEENQKKVTKLLKKIYGDSGTIWHIRDHHFSAKGPYGQKRFFED